MEPYEPDRSWRGKLRRRTVRLRHRKPADRALAKGFEVVTVAQGAGRVSGADA